MKSLLPIAIKIAARTIGDDIIGMKPDEKWEDGVSRHNCERLIRERNLKIEKILKKKGK